MRTEGVSFPDTALRDAAERQQGYALAIQRRLDDYVRADNPVDRALALFEAEAAGDHFESVSYEIALRLLGHGIPVDPSQDVAAFLLPLRLAISAHEAIEGPLVRA